MVLKILCAITDYKCIVHYYMHRSRAFRDKERKREIRTADDTHTYNSFLFPDDKESILKNV